jgi:4-hydroxybenzoate polyprenyltransferase
MLAGGEPTTALRLGASMTSLQFAIGALNDIVDAPADAGRVPHKPIPAGIIDARSAALVTAVAALVGLALAAPSGGGLLVLAAVVLAIGAAYDLFAKGTSFSWIPFAIGIPILPIYGWYGATDSLPPRVAVLIVMAALAGAGLAVANARADLDTDSEAATTSVATALGPARSWWIDAGLLVAAIGLGIVSLAGSGFSLVPLALIGPGVGLAIVGLVVGRRPERGARRRSWELQAIGIALAAAGWIGALVPRAM